MKTSVRLKKNTLSRYHIDFSQNTFLGLGDTIQLHNTPFSTFNTYISPFLHLLMLCVVDVFRLIFLFRLVVIILHAATRPEVLSQLLRPGKRRAGRQEGGQHRVRACAAGATF